MDIDYNTLKGWGNNDKSLLITVYEITKFYLYPWLYISENYIFTRHTLTLIRNYRKKQQKLENKEQLIKNIKDD